MDKVVRFLFLKYRFWIFFLSGCILLNGAAKPAWCFDDAKYYQGFLVNQMMIQKIREFRGEKPNTQYADYLFNEALVKGVDLPSWAYESLQKKTPEHNKLRLFEKERPIEYESIIFDASKQYRLPPELIKAIIKVESNFIPEAVSPKGAQGLMQLMPGTAKEIGIENSFDPRQNIFAGSFLLKKYIDKYGSIKKTLIAYNAGPGWVHKKVIPAETRNYIRDVVYYYQRYNDLK